MSDSATVPDLRDPVGHRPTQERTSFFDEQQRRRRSGRLLSFVCLLIASGIGIVLSVLVTPLLLLAGGGLMHLLARLGCLPETMRNAAHGFGAWAASHMNHFDALIKALDHVNGPADLISLLPPLLLLAPVCVPALVAAGVVWLGLRGIAGRYAGEDLILRLHARPPNHTDLEEHQLANIIEETSIAAGIPAPRLLLIDSPVINAAAVGRSRRDSTILVTRGLLEELDRDETSGVIAHLVASIGKGDIRLSHGILAVFQTFGFFLAFTDLTYRTDAWRALGGLVLVVTGVRRSPEAVEQTLLLLENGIGADAMPDVETMWGSVIPYPRLRKILMVPVLPLLLVTMLLKLVLFLWTALFLGPPLSLIWCNRRYSADAMAVQLTRNPDGLARALSKIGDSGIPPGGEGREYYFIHGPRGTTKGSFADRRTITVSLHPSLARRWRRLVALGAQGDGRRPPILNLEMIARYPLRAALGAFLLLLLIPLGMTLVVMVLYLTALAMTMGLAAGLGIAAGVLG